MNDAPRTYTLQDGQTVAVRTDAAASGGALLELDAEWAPADSKPPAHLHPRQDERFEVSEGELSAELDGGVQVLRAGDVLDVPHGTVHRMWNSGATPARASWQVRPALRTEQLFAAMDESRAYRRSEKGGAMTTVGAAPVLRAFRDEFRLPLPDAPTRPLLAALSLVARIRGYPRPEARPSRKAARKPDEIQRPGAT